MLVVESIKLEVYKWVTISKKFKGFQLVNIHRDWLARDSSKSPAIPSSIAIWKPPPRGWIKLGFTGSSLGNPGLVGVGWGGKK